MAVQTLKRTLPSECLRSERITLRRHELELAETMFGYVDADRARLREFLPWVDGTRTLQDERDYIRMSREKWDEHQLFDYGLFRNEDGLYLGNAGVHTISWEHRRCEIGYWILGRFEGQGYMSEAVGALEREVFGLGFHRIEIHCSSRNQRSAAVPRRCKYRLEGTLRHDRIELGAFTDTYVFAKLATDELTNS
jgi:RimJ/RimL family protein N-acetyltransferase